jgi:hypothetical protein
VAKAASISPTSVIPSGSIGMGFVFESHYTFVLCSGANIAFIVSTMATSTATTTTIASTVCTFAHLEHYIASVIGA